MTATLLALAAVTLLAYAVKAATGFGPALVVVAFGSLLIGPVHAVILAAFLDLASGIGLVWIDRHRIRDVPWAGPAAAMAAGAVAGALLLDLIPTAGLTRLVGVGVTGFGVWMLRPLESPSQGETRTVQPEEPRGQAPSRRRWIEHAVAAVGGVSGGLIGIGGPPLIIYYGTRLRKRAFRATLVPILLAAAVFRAGTYTLTGQVDRSLLPLILASLPALPVGLWLGNRLFRRVPEQAFRRLVALLVTVVGVRLLM